MLILNINLRFDPADVGKNLVRAINKYSKYTARHLSDSRAVRIDGWKDIEYDRANPDELADLIERADILHFNQYDWETEGCEAVVKYIRPHHKIVFHGHGGAWLLDPTEQIRRCEEVGATMVMCSPMDEAAVGSKHGRWIPNIIPLHAIRTPDWTRDFDGELTVGLSANHSNGVYKGAEMVQYMVEHLGKLQFGYPLKYELVTGMTLEDSLAVRRGHHFTVDNWVQGFSGMAGFEGLAMGHVVFARFDPMVREKWEAFAPEMIPIVDIKGFDTCAAKLREYCNDRELLKNHCLMSRAWMEYFYNEERILDMWIKFYESL